MSEVKMDNTRKWIGIFIIAAIVAILAFVTLSATASAAVINVPSAGNETIQQAINNASTGDTILVNAAAYAGTTETVDVTQSNIIIRSVNGRAVIDANGADDHVVDITNQTNVTLDGFTIRNAYGTTRSVAGIYMENATECTISNTIVTNISATGFRLGARGISLTDSHNNSFSSSISVSSITAINGAYAHGIILEDSHNNIFSSSISVSSITGEGVAYGIFLLSSNNSIFSSSISVSSIAATDGYVYGIRLLWSNNNTFSSSISVSSVTAPNYDAYGIFLRSSSNNTFTDFTITEVASDSGTTAYGIWLHVHSNNNVFSGGNIYSTGEPRIDYAVWLDDSTHNTINDSDIRDNGHGFWLDQSDNNTIERNMIVNNTALPVSGVFLSIGSDNNEVHENCFYYNGYELLQAVDHGSQNNLDRNYWEPPPYGAPGDPYLITGDAGSRDNHPLAYCPLCAVEVPVVTPIGLVALVGLLSVLAVLTMRRKRR
jgi:parallel beta-helix repeat protein